MAYRKMEKPKPKPNRTVHDAVTPLRAYVHNGQTSNLAFPCWYQEVHWPTRARKHDWHKHDHQGWPSPTHPDHSCQMPHYMHRLDCPPYHDGHNHCRHVKHLLRMDSLEPIHLLREGYEDVDIAWTGEHEGITASGYIDLHEDWTVRVRLDVLDRNAIEEPQVYKFTVYVNMYDTNHDVIKRDIVALVELTVLPSAI